MPTHSASSPFSRPWLAVALACAVSMPVAALAQGSPGSFQLPDPTPTPTPVPQGPVDERAGVPIAPRIIPEAGSSPAPTPTPSPSPPPAPAENEAAETTENAPSQGETLPQASATEQPTVSQPSRRTPSTAAPSPVPQLRDGPTTTGATPVPEPSIDTLPSVGPDDWYTVDQPGSETGLPDDASRQSNEGGIDGILDSVGEFLSETRTLAIAAVLLVLLAGAAGWVWLRRRLASQPDALEAPALAAGVRNSIAATQLRPEPGTPIPPQLTPEPLHIDLSLEIVGASRSVMMFMLDYRLNIANRSGTAARDLAVTAQLTCAQRGESNAPSLGAGQPVETIERIGPHQSRSVSGQLQIPLTEVQAIRQGQKPIFIPLLHVTIAGAADDVVKRSKGMKIGFCPCLIA
ncbi:MAG: hypothetical protein QNJ15_04045 [Erythrobacter sp.]|nr:hypothetical protein [Erythrobacter sp.]